MGWLDQWVNKLPFFSSNKSVAIWEHRTVMIVARASCDWKCNHWFDHGLAAMQIQNFKVTNSAMLFQKRLLGSLQEIQSAGFSVWRVCLSKLLGEIPDIMINILWKVNLNITVDHCAQIIDWINLIGRIVVYLLFCTFARIGHSDPWPHQTGY